MHLFVPTDSGQHYTPLHTAHHLSKPQSRSFLYFLFSMEYRVVVSTVLGLGFLVAWAKKDKEETD